MTTAYRPLIEVPPPCNIPTAAGWCVLPEGHTGSCVPIPATYPPTPTVVREVAGPQTPGTGVEGEAPAGPGPRLTDADVTALRAMQAPVISANDGACVCGAEDGLFADPDPQCGVGSHRLAAQQSGADR